MAELRAKIATAGDHVDREAIRKCFRKSKRRAQGTAVKKTIEFHLVYNILLASKIAKTVET